MSVAANRLFSLILTGILATVALTATTEYATAQSKDIPRGIPYLTNRDKTGSSDPDKYYGEERSTVRGGWCFIEETILNGMSSLAEVAPFHIPDEILRVEKIREAASDDIAFTLQTTSKDRPLLLYTHGFYIDFEKGCRRATVFQENVGFEGRFLWFSWPSDGSLTNYTHDEADLYWSVPDFADLIIGLEERFGGDRVNLAGHSLGGRGLVLALSEVASRNLDIRLGEVVLLAPDMDFGIFQRSLPRISPIVSGITIYFSDTDRPLALSAQVHGYPRLGESGNDVSVLEGVEVIDLSELQVRSPTGHLYHVYNKEVGEDLKQLLDDRTPAGQRRNMKQQGTNLWTLLPSD